MSPVRCYRALERQQLAKEVSKGVLLAMIVTGYFDQSPFLSSSATKSDEEHPSTTVT
jgi:hypothetical protein